ncbi:MAG: SOS response-associated peptidase [Chloroflexi bacterium]|nr:SOS response-associated peptidase [Chloroflexota bacterium]
MCARFTLTAGVAEIAAALGVDPAAIDAAGHRPRYNVAPTQPHFIVRERREERQALPARWGLVNSWATDAKRAGAQINARAEDVPRRRAYRAAWEQGRRCLVPADGFFEWTGPKSARQPVWFHRPEGGLILLAGLYESWRAGDDDEWRRTFTILTTRANGAVAPIHDRMPVILSPDDAAEWVYPGNAPDAVSGLLRPAPESLLVGEAVSRRVNSVRNDDPACLALEPEAELATHQGALFS